MFAVVIDKVLICGYDEDGKKNPNLVTYVFDMEKEDLKAPLNHDDYIVIAEDEIEYSFWSQALTEEGSRKKVHYDSFLIRIALITK